MTSSSPRQEAERMVRGIVEQLTSTKEAVSLGWRDTQVQLIIAFTDALEPLLARVAKLEAERAGPPYSMPVGGVFSVENCLFCNSPDCPAIRDETDQWNCTEYPSEFCGLTHRLPPHQARLTVGEEPVRIQRKREKGWRLPPNTVCVDRSTRWGNGFRIGSNYHAVEFGGDPNDFPPVVSAAQATLLFEQSIMQPHNAGWRAMAKDALRGKNLACWCPLTDSDGKQVPCHADILLRLVNAGDQG